MKGDRKPQLFCFPCAGGTAAFFEEIAGDLPETDWVPLEYAGHGTRRKEPFYERFEQLTDDLYPRLREAYGGGAYALFGYSMGSIAAAEILKRILAEGEMAPPAHVFLAAHEPHAKAELEGFTPEERDEWVKERTIRFGAIPEKLIHNASFWRIFLPLYRADYAMIGKYRFEELSLRTDVPATVFYSETDTPRREMELWRHYFTGDCAFAGFSGRHFFIREHHREMAEMIRSSMGL